MFNSVISVQQNLKQQQQDEKNNMLLHLICQQPSLSDCSSLASSLSSSASSVSSLTNNMQQQNNSSAASAANRYKTELCRSFQENGTCKYGDKCQFAHGHNELRSMMRHPKYKTELCKTFHASGYCPYGPRCHFVHDTSLDIQKPSNNSISIKTNSKNKENTGLLMCADEKFQFTSDSFSVMNSKENDYTFTSSKVSTYSNSSANITPPSSRSLSPDNFNTFQMNLDTDDSDFNTNLIVNQILNNIYTADISTTQYGSNSVSSFSSSSEYSTFSNIFY
jgi:butyrate response factor 1